MGRLKGSKNKPKNLPVVSDIVPGGLGTMTIGGQEREVLATKSDFTKGSLTFTLGAKKETKTVTEDVEAEVIESRTNYTPAPKATYDPYSNPRFKSKNGLDKK
jgi:hypothetical protein